MDSYDSLRRGFMNALHDFWRIARAIIGLLVFIAAPFGGTAARFALWIKRY